MNNKLKHIIFISIFVFCFSQTQAEVKVSDTAKFWNVTYVDWIKGKLPEQKQLTAVCKSVGTHCYFFLDIAYTKPLLQTSVDSLVNRFDNDYYSRLTELYGPCPDVLDNDPKIYILAVKPDWYGGYFDPAQQMPDTMVARLWGVHSSEHEIIYMSAEEVQPAGASVIAHEFGHMLGWQQDHSPEPPDNPTYYWEDTWVDEGFSTFAESYLNGNLNQKIKLYFSFLNDSLNTSLIYFSYSINYNSSLLFMTYMWEHFGKEQYIRSLLRNQLNGIAGVESTVKSLGYDLTFDEIFENWTLANYINNINVKNGEYFYKHYEFNNILHRHQHAVYNVSVTDSLRAYSSHYIKLTNPDTSVNLKLKFVDSGNSKFRLALIYKIASKDSVVDIIALPLNGSKEAEFDIKKFGKDFDNAILVVMNTDSTLKELQFADYNYELTTYPTDIIDSELKSSVQISYKEIEKVINISFQNSLSFEKQVSIFNTNGQMIYEINFIDDNYKFNVSKLSMGLYLLVIRCGTQTYSKPMLVY